VIATWRSLLRAQGVPGVALWPLRGFLGVTFIWASVDKLRDPAFFNAAAPGYIGHQLALSANNSPLGGLLTGFIVPQATLFGMLTMAGELLIGLAVLLGWYTRFSAVMGLLINLLFWLTITWDVQPYYYGADLVFVVAWLTLALTGPGPISVDAYLKQWAQAPDGPARSGATSPGVRPAGVPGGSPRPASGPPARPGARPAGATRVRPAPRFVNGQLVGGASPPPSAPAAGLTRRQFNVLGLSALGAAVLGLLEMGAWSVLHTTGPVGAPPTAPGGAAPTTAPTAAAAPPGQQIAAAGQVPAGQALEFTHPGDGYPAVLVHNDSGYSAYYAICTHEGCQVSYSAAEQLIACPCHGALFDPKSNGQVVRGPARQPLQPIAITVGPDGAVYLAG